VPEGAAVGKWLTAIAAGVRIFYDLDTPVTLARLAADDCEYLAPHLVRRFDLYLSFTGGPTLSFIEREFGAPRARAFYCMADPQIYYPEHQKRRFDLGYLGTWSADRQPALEQLLLRPATRSLPNPRKSFIVAGPQYPAEIRWPANVRRLEHLAPARHRRFYNAQRFTLNITRQPMVHAGYSPSVRLFEAAACGTPIISDVWDGIETVLEPGREILLARDSADVLRYLNDLPETERLEVARRARRRILHEHTAEHRAREFEAHIAEACAAPRPACARGG
jgi:spore maturation protein CgeB